MYHKAALALRNRKPAALKGMGVFNARSPRAALGVFNPRSPRAALGDDIASIVSDASGATSQAAAAAGQSGGGGLFGGLTSGGGGGGVFDGAGAATSSWSSGGGGSGVASGIGAVLGGVAKAFSTPSTPQYGMPGYPGAVGYGGVVPGAAGYPYGYPQAGMSTMTKVVLAGGAAALLVMLSRR